MSKSSGRLRKLAAAAAVLALAGALSGVGLWWARRDRRPVYWVARPVGIMGTETELTAVADSGRQHILAEASYAYLKKTR